MFFVTLLLHDHAINLVATILCNRKHRLRCHRSQLDAKIKLKLTRNDKKYLRFFNRFPMVRWRCAKLVAQTALSLGFDSFCYASLICFFFFFSIARTRIIERCNARARALKNRRCFGKSMADFFSPIERNDATHTLTWPRSISYSFKSDWRAHGMRPPNESRRRRHFEREKIQCNCWLGCSRTGNKSCAYMIESCCMAHELCCALARFHERPVR